MIVALHLSFDTSLQLSTDADERLAYRGRRHPDLFRQVTCRPAITVTTCHQLPAFAQEPTAEELAAANNPLADLKAFNVQNYYVPSLSGVEGSADHRGYSLAQNCRA